MHTLLLSNTSSTYLRTDKILQVCNLSAVPKTKEGGHDQGLITDLPIILPAFRSSRALFA